jgi:hypothetical protein
MKAWEWLHELTSAFCSLNVPCNSRLKLRLSISTVWPQESQEFFPINSAPPAFDPVRQLSHRTHFAYPRSDASSLAAMETNSHNPSA